MAEARMYDGTSWVSVTDEGHRTATDPHSGYHNDARGDARYVQLGDTRLSDARTPTAHAGSHAAAGSDPVTPAAIGAAASAHNHDGTYATVAHNHDGTYATVAHNHDSAYASLAHNHDAAYATAGHTHTVPIPVAFSRAGTLTTSVGAHRWYNDTGATLTISTVRASVGTAPTGASLIVDVNVNGTTIYSTQANRPTVAASTNTATGGAASTTTVAAGQYLTVDCDQIGSTVAGADLTVQILLTRTV